MRIRKNVAPVPRTWHPCHKKSLVIKILKGVSGLPVVTQRGDLVMLLLLLQFLCFGCDVVLPIINFFVHSLK
jgi:hypothetical protein